MKFPKMARGKLMIQALIDGDWILYAAGFAGQKTRHIYLFEKGGPEDVGNVTEARAKCTEYGEEYQPSAMYSNVVCDPLDHVFHSAKNMIKREIAEIEKRMGDKVDPIVMMDGDGNFRSRLATIKPYKGTRSVHAKPVLYNDIRQYLLDHWNAEVIYDQETDDEMAIRQTEAIAAKRKSVIVAVDKDMLQVPGLHRNPNKGFRKVTVDSGELFLYRQAAMGDSTDNIGGAYKFGAKAAEAAITAEMSERDKWEAVVDLYAKSIDKYGDVYNGLNSQQAALENMRLVYLRRARNEPLWLPPQARGK